MSLKEGDFAKALSLAMEDLEYNIYVNMSSPLPLFFLLDPDYKPAPMPVMTREEWWVSRHQLHPTRFDLDYELLPDQIYLNPGNYEWWRLPEEDDDCEC